MKAVAIAECLDGLADKLALEIDRYRAALEKIRDAHPSVVTTMSDGCWRDACRDFQSIARTALAAQQREP